MPKPGTVDDWVPHRVRQPLAAPPVLNQTRALDFMNDEGNRERLEIALGTSLPGRRVIRVLDELVAAHGGQSPYALST